MADRRVPSGKAGPEAGEALHLGGPPPHSFGAVLTAVRRATIATGDVLALSVTASGDGDIELVGAT